MSLILLLFIVFCVVSSLVLLSQFLSVHIPGVEVQPTLESTEVDGWGDALPLL